MVLPSLAVASLVGISILAFRQWQRGRATSERMPEAPNLLSLVTHLPGMAYRSRMDRLVEFASSGALELTGHPAEAFASGAVSLADLVHPEDAEALEAEIAAAITERRPYQLMYRIYRRDGTQRWVWERGSVTSLGGEHGQTMLEGFIADVTARKATEDRLLQEALHDSLTGLPNRTLLAERLEMAIRRSLRRPAPAFAVLFLDLDRFKMITDSLGRELGDQALRATARRLQACLRQEDTVARVGGDEFAILLEDVVHASDVVRVAHRLCEVVGLPLYLEGEEVFTTCSIGIATSLSGYEHPEDALRDAEIAMYRAKTQGGGRHQLFDPAMHQSAIAQLRLETDLRRALKLQEFRLLYQPIYDLRDGRLMGFEALLRWFHGGRLHLPNEFLDTAFSTGLIVPISWWVLAEACRQIVLWQRRAGRDRPLFVSVNLTSHQLAVHDLADRIRNVLLTTGAAADRLRIEITESVFLDRTDAVTQTLDELRELGIHIALDDFGTGYSSLSSLRQLPIGSLKIDRSFVAGLEAKGTNQEIIRAIVALAHTLGLGVVAEGVETADQAEILTEIGCENGQGFYFGVPMEPSDIGVLLTANPFEDADQRWA